MNRFSDVDVSIKRLPPVYGYHSEKLVTIEKALEPIESQINELSRYIKIAKRYCHFPSEHDLTKDQSAAIYIYTMEWGDTTLYRVLNKALRSEDRSVLKIWFPYLKLFDTALDKLPTIKDILWRGVNIDIGKNFTKNQLVTWWSFNSCSSSVNVIKNFLGNNKNATLFLIEAINGKKISGYTQYENEDEVILRIGTELRVKADTLEHSGSHIVHLIEIDYNDNDEILTSSMTKMNVTSKPLDQDASNVGATEPKIDEVKDAQVYTNNKTIQMNKTDQYNTRSEPHRASLIDIPANATWNNNGQTVGGQNPTLSSPRGLYVDDEQTIYVADRGNHRIVAWKSGETNGQVVAGGHGQGNGAHQLNYLTDVIVDKERDNLIICDRGNRRLVKWPRLNGTSGEVIISNITCYGLTMDDNGFLYVTDVDKHEVRRYRMGETEGIVVAGGNGKGNRLDQLNFPTYIFVDREHSVFVSDHYNHRVMKWMEGAKEGIVVAGGQGEGNSLIHLHYPNGVVVDQLGTVYVADKDNHRIVRWPKGAQQGNVIVGGNGEGAQVNQVNYPIGLSFDREGNLYVVDFIKKRVQRFNIEVP